MTAPDPRAWRVAIALALALPEPPDWALWASGETADPRPATWWCTRCEREGRPDFGAHVPTWSTRAYCRVCIDEYVDPTMKPAGSPTPVPAPWDVPAYLADCARRQVEPGPLPSLEYVPTTGLWWKVSDHATVTIGHGVQTLWDVLWSGNYAMLRPRFRSADVDAASAGFTLATAAAKAMG